MCPLKNEERQSGSVPPTVDSYLGGSRSQRVAGSVFKWIFYFMLLLTLLIEAFSGWLNYIPDISEERKIWFRGFLKGPLHALNEAMKKLQSCFHHSPPAPPPPR